MKWEVVSEQWCQFGHLHIVLSNPKPQAFPRHVRFDFNDGIAKSCCPDSMAYKIGILDFDFKLKKDGTYERLFKNEI